MNLGTWLYLGLVLIALISMLCKQRATSDRMPATRITVQAELDMAAMLCVLSQEPPMMGNSK